MKHEHEHESDSFFIATKYLLFDNSYRVALIAFCIQKIYNLCAYFLVVEFDFARTKTTDIVKWFVI